MESHPTHTHTYSLCVFKESNTCGVGECLYAYVAVSTPKSILQNPANDINFTIFVYIYMGIHVFVQECLGAPKQHCRQGLLHTVCACNLHTLAAN